MYQMEEMNERMLSLEEELEEAKDKLSKAVINPLLS